MPLHNWTAKEKAEQKRIMREIAEKYKPVLNAVQVAVKEREKRALLSKPTEPNQHTQPTAEAETAMKKTTKPANVNAVGIRVGTFKEAVYNALLKGGTVEQLTAMAAKSVKDSASKAKDSMVRWYINDLKTTNKVAVVNADGVYSVKGGKK